MTSTTDFSPQESLGESRGGWQSHPILQWPYWSRAIVVLCGLILIYRRPDAVSNPLFWAEDGTNFFTDAREHGLASLFQSFTNYPMLFIRLVAYALSFLPDAIVPAAYNAVAFLNHIAVVVYLFSARIPLRWKPLLALFSVLAPCLGNEPLFNLTNSQWQSAQLLLLLIVSNDSTTKWQAWFDAALLVLLGLTGPYLVMFFPLILARWWWRRTPQSRRFLLLAVAPLIVQLVMMASLPPYGPRITTAFNPANPIWLGVYGDSIAGVLFMGFNAPLYWQNSVLMTLLSVLLYAVLGWDAVRRKDSTQLALLYASLAVLFAASVYWRGQPEVVIQSSRYHYLHRVLFFWALIQSASHTGFQTIPLRALAVWAVLAAVPGAQTNYASTVNWPYASVLLDVKGDVILPCMQPKWWVRVRNSDEGAAALRREELLKNGQVVVLGHAPSRKPDTLMRFQNTIDARGITFRYRAKSEDGQPRELTVELGRPGKPTADSPIPLKLIADGQQHEITFYAGGPIGGWILNCAPGMTEVVIEQIVKLN
jgi:hypothetical protein